jgi:hypothetical protein
VVGGKNYVQFVWEFNEVARFVDVGNPRDGRVDRGTVPSGTVIKDG